MSIYHIDENTVGLLFNRIQSVHSIPDLTTEILALAINREISKTKSDLERSLLGQLVMFQEHSSLSEALSACTYSQTQVISGYDSDLGEEVVYMSESNTACSRETNMLVRYYSLILNNQMEDFVTVRYTTDFCGCSTNKLIHDIEPMYVDGYVQSRGLANTALIEQYKALVLRSALLSIARAVWYVAMIEATGLTDSRKQNSYVWNIEDKVHRKRFKLSKIPPERYNAFCDIIYKPITVTMETDRYNKKGLRRYGERAKQDGNLNYWEWSRTLLEQQLNRSGCSRLDDHMTKVLYYKYYYQEPAEVTETISFDLDLLVPSCDQMLIEI